MKVFIVMYYNYEETWYKGVFGNLLTAELFVEKQIDPRNCEIFEEEVQ